MLNSIINAACLVDFSCWLLFAWMKVSSWLRNSKRCMYYVAGQNTVNLNWFQPCLVLNFLSYFLESLLLINKSWKSMLNVNFEHFGSLQWRTVVFFQSKRDICVFERQRKWFSVIIITKYQTRLNSLQHELNFDLIYNANILPKEC